MGETSNDEFTIVYEVQSLLGKQNLRRSKCMRIAVLTALLAAPALFAQTPAQQPYSRVAGSITAVDATAKVLTVKTTTADSSVKYDDKTSFLRMTPGETDTKKATPMKNGEIETGDRILALILNKEPVPPATRIYVFRKEELTKRDEKTQEDWATKSVTGIVQSIDASAKSVTIKVKGKDVAVDVSGAVNFRRYNADSAKTTDLKDSSLAEIAAGDQFRVLGAKNDDGSKIKANAVVTGAFRTVGVVVKSIDAAAGTITGTDAATKKMVVIKVTADTSVKRLQPMFAMMMARQLNPNFQAPGGRGGGAPAGAGGAASGGAAGGPPAGMSQGGGRPGGMGGPGGARMDTAKMLESQPAIQLAELKAGDALIVYGLATADLAKLNSLNVIAGAEMILTAAPKGGADPLGGAWNFGGGEGGGN